MIQTPVRAAGHTAERDPIRRAGQQLAAALAELCADYLAEGRLALAASMADQRARLLAGLAQATPTE